MAATNAIESALVHRAATDPPDVSSVDVHPVVLDERVVTVEVTAAIVVDELVPTEAGPAPGVVVVEPPVGGPDDDWRPSGLADFVDFVAALDEVGVSESFVVDGGMCATVHLALATVVDVRPDAVIILTYFPNAFG